MKAQAGPNAGGTLILHANTSIVYTDGITSYCGQAGLASCGSAVTSVPSNTEPPTVFFALAAFPDGSSPRLSGVTFGVGYDAEALMLLAHGHCADFELASDTWPAPGSGTALTWNAARAGLVTELCWFVGYAYADTASFALTGHPTQGGNFADDGVPSALDPIDGYGRIGFGVAGSGPCPGTGIDAPGGDGGNGPTGGNEGDGGGGGGGDNAPDLFVPDPACRPFMLPILSFEVGDRQVELPAHEHRRVPLSRTRFRDGDLRAMLEITNASSISRPYHWREAEQREARGDNGRMVRQRPMSNFVQVEFPDLDQAVVAYNALASLPGIRHLGFESSLPTLMQPEDVFYQTWPPPCEEGYNCEDDPQWPVLVAERRPAEGLCSEAEFGADIGITDSAWPLSAIPVLGEKVMIGIVDVGLPASQDGSNRPDSFHEDLIFKPLTTAQRIALSDHPDSSWCGEHATAMAGLMAARTDSVDAEYNFTIGVAGICDGCRLLDIEACQDRPQDPERSTCADHDCEYLTEWAPKVAQAADWFREDGFRACLISAGGHEYSTNAEVLAIWNAYRRGIGFASPCGDQTQPEPYYLAPANLPYVLGVGGHVHDGRFWDTRSACLDRKGTPVGPSTVSVTAPADPGYVTTLPRPNPNYEYMWPRPVFYTKTSGQASGASAIATGVLGWLLTLHTDRTGNDLPIDDAMGMIEGTALPFAEPPWLDNPPCSTCTPDMYGRGRINARGAGMVLDLYEAELDIVAPMVARYGDAGWQETRVRTLWWLVGQDTVRWALFRETAELQFPPLEDAWLPRYVAWGNNIANLAGDSTTTRLLYGSDVSRQRQKDMVDLAVEGPTACELSNIDEGGNATLTGYNLAKIEWNGVDSVYTYLVEPQNLQMAYSVLTTPQNPAEVAPGAQHARSRAPRITLLGNPSSGETRFRYELDRAGDVEWRIIDAAGRRVASASRAGLAAGVHADAWNGELREGGKARSGLYWLEVTANGKSSARRLIVVR